MELKGTTIVGVKVGGKTVIAGDGQVTAGQSVVMKGNAVKVRRLYNDKVVVGFAGSVADAFTLTEKFEEMLNKYSGKSLLVFGRRVVLSDRDDRHFGGYTLVKNY